MHVVPLRAPQRLIALIGTLLFLFLLLFNGSPTWAQEGVSAGLTRVETGGFPSVSAYLSVRDEAGGFITGLQASDLTVIEGEGRLPVLDLQEIEAGAVFAIAVSPGRPFAIRDGQGISRWDLIREALKSWVEAAPAVGQDDLSLLIQDGPQAIHADSREEIGQALELYTGNLRAAEPDLSVLLGAIETAAGEAPRSGMGRVVLYITPRPSTEMAARLPDLSAQAKAAGVRVSVWMVTSSDLGNTAGVDQLKLLAETTGGEFFSFSGEETLPDPESYLAAMREVYFLSYKSGASAAGVYPVRVEINRDGSVVTTEAVDLNLDIQPPQAAFLALPVEVVRQNPDEARDLMNDLDPDSLELELQIEFPDGLPRPLLSSTLYVDGIAVVSNEEEPFNRFLWNLGGYLESGDHILRVEVIDSQGLHGSTADTAVYVEVKRIEPSLWRMVSQNGAWFAGIFAVLAGSVLALVLLLGGRIKPKIPGRKEPARSKSKPPLGVTPRAKDDPVTQPIFGRVEPEPKAKHGLLGRFLWHQRSAQPSAFAYLTLLDEHSAITPGAPLAIPAETVIIGRDRVRCDIVLDDPSIEGVHAKITPEGEGLRIADSGSVAGTWVNYSPVSEEGTPVEHGDIVHIGRLGFRVSFKQPARIRKPVIIREGEKP